MTTVALARGGGSRQFVGPVVDTVCYSWLALMTAAMTVTLSSWLRYTVSNQGWQLAGSVSMPVLHASPARSLTRR